MPPLPERMTVIEIRGRGGPEVLQLGSRPLPEPARDEVLIRIAAAGVNRPDVMQCQGHHPPPPGASDIPGLEAAGEVVALGAGVTDRRGGDPVTALLAGGGYAEYCTVPAPQVLPLPRGLDWVRGAALPETFFTVWTNLFRRAGLQAGERVLIHGGASGIGTTAIQLAHAFGARVFATAGSPEKCAACEKLGAQRAIDYREEDFVTVVKEATSGEGVDVILDMVGGDYLARNMTALRREGRLVNIAYLKGAKTEIDLKPLLVKRLTITGSTLRIRSVEEKGRIARELYREVWPLIESGRVAPVIDQTFPLEDAAKAHRLMLASGHIGKIVLTLTPGVST